MKINKIWSIEILDSRGFPTLKTFVELENGVIGNAAIPSGASTGTYEAHELRDNDPHRFNGKGVLTAKHNVDVILNDLLKGRDASDQETLDRLMIKADGTENKTNLGANAILSVSLATARAAAQAQKKELYQYLNYFFKTPLLMPMPMVNVLNGGKHAERSSDIQEYMLFPYGFSNYSESLRATAEVFQQLKQIVSKMGFSTAVGDEGGFAPSLKDNYEPLNLLVDAITEAGYVSGDEFGLGIDSAASEFFENNKYNLKTENKVLSTNELVNYYIEMQKLFPICSLEDHFAEDDWQGFVNLNEHIGNKIQTVGDDLYVTNPKRFRKGIELKASNAILVKLNQIGTLSETIEVIKMAKEAKMQVVISHRSGETEDSFIADLVVASGVGQIKAGSMSRSERLVKYNRLLEIEAKEPSIPFYQFPYKTNGY
jgi:enolase